MSRSPGLAGASSCMTVRFALRSMLPKPKLVKPPEPQGLGAVVKDAEGDRWVNVGHGNWGSSLSLSHYADIDAVEVLSEGIGS